MNDKIVTDKITGVVHSVTRAHGSKDTSGYMAFTKPVCSCGWTGRACYAYEDDMMSQIAKQERLHMDDHRTGKVK